MAALYHVLNAVDPYGLEVYICARQFYSGSPEDYSDWDYGTQFDRGRFPPATPRIAHFFILIVDDETGATSSYSFHPDVFTYEVVWTANGPNKARPGRVAIDDPNDSEVLNPSYWGRSMCFKIPCESEDESGLQEYINDWIEANGVGIERGRLEKRDKANPGNWNAVDHQAPSEGCTAYYWVNGQNCTWWSTTMLTDAGLTIPDDTWAMMQKWNWGRGQTVLYPDYGGKQLRRRIKRSCHNRCDINPWAAPQNLAPEPVGDATDFFGGITPH